MEANVLTTGLLAKTKPEVIDSLNNGQGTFLYNHNIKEVKVIADKEGGIEITTDAERATGTMFQYDSVRVEYPKTADNIFSTLLTARYPAKTESKLVNEYQSAMLGLLAESAKSPYENFLKDRLAIREMVDAPIPIIMTVRQRTSIIRQLSFFHRKGGNRMKHAEKEEKQPSFLKRHFNAIATVCIVLIPTIYTAL